MTQQMDFRVTWYEQRAVRGHPIFVPKFLIIANINMVAVGKSDVRVTLVSYNKTLRISS